jgi:hypothetical protein
MDIISLIISIIGTGASIYAVYISLDVPPWLSAVVLVAALLIISLIIYLFVNERKRRAQRYSAVRLGLEWIRLIYDAGDENRVRASYFEIKCCKMRNVARVPYGTRKTKVAFGKGEGFAGACWSEYEMSAQRFLIVSDLPALKEDQEKLVNEYRARNVNLGLKKILMFKKDIKSYLVVALQHPGTRDIMGTICLDSTEPFEFEAPDNKVEEREDYINKLENVFKVVDIIGRALYSK